MKYTTPEMELILISDEDILTGSPISTPEDKFDDIMDPKKG